MQAVPDLLGVQLFVIEVSTLILNSIFCECVENRYTCMAHVSAK